MTETQDSPVTFGNPCGNYLDHMYYSNTSAHYPQADGQTNYINCTIGYILSCIYLLDED